MSARPSAGIAEHSQAFKQPRANTRGKPQSATAEQAIVETLTINRILEQLLSLGRALVIME